MECTVVDCQNTSRPNKYKLCSKHERRNKLYGSPTAGIRPFDTGRSKQAGYSSWLAAKGRCYDKNNKAYKHYGARGIKICKHWLNDSQAFLDDMGERPIGMTLERIDVNKDYSPENCKWASWDEQRRNKRPYTYRDKFTHCGKGHTWTPENTGLNKLGGRWCKACSRIHGNERYKKVKTQKALD